MQSKYYLYGAGMALCGLAAFAGTGQMGPKSGMTLVSERAVAQVLPGTSTKAQVESALGKPYRIVQFTDCGHSTAMPGQTDETWDYRGRNAQGAYHVHIEFGDNGVATLISKIPDETTDGKGFAAKLAPGAEHRTMAGMKM
jgi:outer membrane protein assembly factor BamE (lipoprotein component of BamABCDE complex)